MKVRKSFWQSMVLACCGAMTAATAQGSVVAIIDSGLDVEHPQMVDSLWENPVDFSRNRLDEDNNGYKDDVNGWDFINNTGILLEEGFSDLYNEEMKRFFDLQTQVLTGTVLEEDLEWLRAKSQDPEFIADLTTFGNYSHGTHVSGIAAAGAANVEIAGLKLIPTENPLAGISSDIELAVAEGKPASWIVKQLVKGALLVLARAQGQAFGDVGAYASYINADVANASLGVGFAQARMIITPLLTAANRGEEPLASDVDELALFFVNKVIEEQTILITSAPKTLFVFAAGNDGTNNDEFPVSPAGIRHPHAMSVAATIGNQALAPFSNFGQTVDIAAPGVGIVSPIPDDRSMALSGTSQAAPAVAGAAGQVVDLNPALQAADIKKLLMGTVDKKEWLQGKVASGGVLNTERALYAAKLAMDMPLAKAIEMANLDIADKIDSNILLQSETNASFYFDFRPALLF